MGVGSSRRLSLTALLLALFLQSVSAQEQPQRAPGTLTEGVTAVLVDVIVRDRRGQPVRDLTEADFEILEDGVPQRVESFTRVFDGSVPPPRAGSSTAAAPATAGSPGAGLDTAAANPLVTAFVFHALTPEGRRRAVLAAQSYVGDAKEELPNYIGIFAIDLSLVPLAPFTRNGLAVRQALNRIATGATSGFNSPEQQQQLANAEQQAAAAGQAAAAAAAAGGPGAAAAVGSSPAAAQLAMMQARAIDEFQSMERDQHGYIATDALFAIVKTLGRLPGRKSLVLFSEGIAIPPAVHRLFLGVIDAANRANVSIYTIDAAGLRAESDQAQIRDRVNQAAGVGISSGFSTDAAGAPYTERLEANEYNLRSDPATGLGQLAQETGGLLFRSTNNLRPAFERIESDLRNYYMLGYTPLNTVFDGRFRNIEVKVKRSGVTVSARKGYFAVRNPGGVPVNASEAPALAALDRTPVPNAFPIRAGALLFPERGRPGLVPIVVDFKTAPLTFTPDPDGKSYTSDFTVLVRFLDSRNQIVRKVSQHYEIRGELSQVEGAKRGEVLFYRESELPPGVYSMETVVHDAPSGKSSVRFSTVEVPRYADGALRMSSIVLVKRGEEVPPEDRRPENPLLVNGVALQPNLGEPVSKAAKQVAFYFAVYPASSGSGPNVMIELLQNAKLVEQLPMPVPPADASGRIQQLGRLPVSSLAPGTYELRVRVQQGEQQVVRTTMLRLTE